MDRPRPQKSRLQRWRGAGLKLAAIPVGLVVLFLLLRAWLGPGVARSEIRTSIAERTPIEATVRGTGSLVPEVEETLSSPISAPIASIRAEAGQRVEEGAVLIELNTTREQVTLDNLDEQLALKDTELRSAEIRLDETLSQQDSRRRLFEVDLESAMVKLDRLHRLADVGAISEEELKEANLEIRRIQIEIEQANKTLETQRQRHEADVERIRLERSILTKQRGEQRRRMDLATVRATRSGLLTWIEQRDGLSVTEGQPLARVSSEQGFRVAALVSDFYTPQLRTGQRVRVTSSSGESMGTLHGILPSPENNTLSLSVELDDPRSAWLRANLRIEAEIITASQEDVITVRRGPAVNGSGFADVYVIEGSSASLRRVELGMSSRDRIEVVDGLEPGEEIVISDMSSYRDHEQLRIR